MPRWMEWGVVAVITMGLAYGGLWIHERIAMGVAAYQVIAIYQQQKVLPPLRPAEEPDAVE